MSSQTLSRNVQTSHHILSGFATLDPDILLFGRTDSCTQVFFPSTIGMPSKTNEDFRKHVLGLRSVIATWPVVPYDTVEDVARRKVVCFARGCADIRDEARDDRETEFATKDGRWVYESEYVFVFEFDEGGKVHRIEEWLDSENTKRIQGLMARARENVKAKA